METGSRLGDYLRARRELMRPEDVGLSDLGRRRAIGLRREELAMLAGISTDYYLRLEQGRDQHPSEQVLEALARALQLDDDATAHLHQLARPRQRRRRVVDRPERVQPGIRQLLKTWSDTPAFVQSRFLDVLAANPLACALSPVYRPGVNVLRALFLDPGVRAYYRDWEKITSGTVGALRELAGPDVDDPRLTDLVGELSVRSELFRRLWARHDVRARRCGTSVIDHPQVGPLELRFEKLSISGGNGQLLVIKHAEPGSPTAQGLALLSSMIAAPGDPGEQGPEHPERSTGQGRVPEGEHGE
ncbi:helix-turn-helix transcriptional regulator [Planotetraspora phitsanulokensis]|uniref:Transcriptional regulator n=1 Tax=Planotetraspora phitsanulokensis TaxID=575192 RepID=A0A8J3U2S0_9ACTN|nr:helix-turn-helix transcriptional regulator [Planotetraspora phitsanulokensis]GII35039.1 transcriptional regulator [Planotetraspora phitsanulokensis]